MSSDGNDKEVLVGPDGKRLLPRRVYLAPHEMPKMHMQTFPKTREEAKKELKNYVNFEPTEKEIDEYWYEFAPDEERQRIEDERTSEELEAIFKAEGYNMEGGVQEEPPE